MKPGNSRQTAKKLLLAGSMLMGTGILVGWATFGTTVSLAVFAVTFPTGLILMMIGAHVAAVCPFCHRFARNSWAFKFCPHCGQRLQSNTG